MNYLEARDQLPGMMAIDLANGFNDERLKGNGELELFNVEAAVLVSLSPDDLLEVSEARLTKGYKERQPRGEPSRFISVRNLGAGSTAIAVLDDAINEVGSLVLADGTVAKAYARSSGLKIGTAPDASPELELSDLVSPYHMSIRIGLLSGFVHFMDLNSATGTTVYLPHGTYLRTQRREWDDIFAEPMQTVEAANGRWSRG